MIDPGAIELARLHAREYRELLATHRRRVEHLHGMDLWQAAERAKCRAMLVLWRAVVELVEEER